MSCRFVERVGKRIVPLQGKIVKNFWEMEGVPGFVLRFMEKTGKIKLPGQNVWACNGTGRSGHDTMKECEDR